MHKLRIILAMQVILVSLLTPVYADNTGTPVAGNTATATTNNTKGEDVLGSENVVSAYSNLFNEVGDATNNETATSVGNTLAPVVASVLGFFAVLIPLGLLLFTGIELACIFFKPLRPMFGAEGGSGGGDMSGGSGNKKVYLQVSEDCIAAINSAGSSGGGCDMAGGSGGTKSLGDIALAYLKLRFKTLVICIITIGLLATPVGYKIILKLTELIFFVIGKVFSFISG